MTAEEWLEAYEAHLQDVLDAYHRWQNARPAAWNRPGSTIQDKALAVNNEQLYRRARGDLGRWVIDNPAPDELKNAP